MFATLSERSEVIGFAAKAGQRWRKHVLVAIPHFEHNLSVVPETELQTKEPYSFHTIDPLLKSQKLPSLSLTWHLSH